MPRKNPFAESTHARGMKLLEESDSELAEMLRDKLEEREDRKQTQQVFRLSVNPSIVPPTLTIKKAGFTLPQVWPLSIDRSFWKDWAFIKWQALRRNHRYQTQVREHYERSLDTFQPAEINHLLQDYFPPSRPSANPLLTWRTWAIRRSAKLKTSEQMEREITERLGCTTKGLDLWPVSPLFCFPHPYFLDRLRPLPFAIPVEPVNRKHACQQYEALLETGLRNPKYLKLDVSLPKDVLRRQVVSYLEGLRSVVQQKRQIINLKPTFQVPRRKISLHVDEVPYWFAVWDLRLQGLSFPEIAGILWPNEYDCHDKMGFPGLPGGEKYPAVQRAQDYYANAKSLIKSLLMPRKKSTT